MFLTTYCLLVCVRYIYGCIRGVFKKSRDWRNIRLYVFPLFTIRHYHFQNISYCNLTAQSHRCFFHSSYRTFRMALTVPKWYLPTLRRWSSIFRNRKNSWETTLDGKMYRTNVFLRRKSRCWKCSATKARWRSSIRLPTALGLARRTLFLGLPRHSR